MNILIWIAIIGSVDSVSEHTSNLCFRHENFVNDLCNVELDNLSCAARQLIRIKEIQIKKKRRGNINNCHGCQSFDDDFDDLEIVTDIVYYTTLLYQACSRKNKCNFASDSLISFWSEQFIWIANITYTCVDEDLFVDICSPLLMETNSTKHISMNSTCNVQSNYSCIIAGKTNSTDIQVVDYRPYTADNVCDGSSFIVDEEEDMFSCMNDGRDFSVYNRDLTVTSSVTYISIKFAHQLPQMIWLHVTGKDLVVECNDEEFMSTLTSTVSTSTATSLLETETSTPVANTKTTAPVLYNEGDAEKNIFTIPVIAGGSAGIVTVVVIVVIIVCVICRRKSNRARINKDKENINTEYNYRPNTDNTRAIRNSAINKSYETDSEMADNRINYSSSYEEIGAMKENNDSDGDNTEYAEPVDVLADNNSEDYTEIKISKSAKTKSNDHNYTEPYDKTIDKDSQNKYTKVMKHEPKKGAYDTCSGIDNYSHIKVVTQKQTPKTVDNYSHLKIAGDKHETSSLENYAHIKVRQKDINKTEESSDAYNHIHIDTEHQKDLVNSEDQTNDEDRNNIEEEKEE